MQTDEIRIEEYVIDNGRRQIYGKLYVPGPGAVKGGVIMSHGYNGSHRHFENEGRALAQNGYYAYAYDFCGGSAEGMSRGLATTEMTLFTEKEDLLAVFEAVSALGPLAGKKVFLMGGSQGGCVTALTAPEVRDRVPGLILYFPALMIPENWRDNYKTVEEIPEVTDFWGMKLGKNFFTSMRDLSVYDVMGAYQGQVLIVHGDKDPIVGMGVVQKAASIYKNTKLVVLEGEGHGFSPAGTEKAIAAILEYLASFE